MFGISGATNAAPTAPTILLQPESQSVQSGDAVTLTVSAEGAEPMFYQWSLNGIGMAGATNDLLTLTNINLLHYGYYGVVVSNNYGAVTSQLALLSVDEDLTFRIINLKTNGLVVIEVNNITGDDRGGMAISSNMVFLTGDNSTGRWTKNGLGSGTSLSTRYDALVSDLRTEKAYTLANGNTPLSSGGGTITSLLEFDNNGNLSGNRINLSRSIYAAYIYDHVGVFSGYGRIVLHTGTNVFDIAMPSGRVTDLGRASPFGHQYTESWCYWGIAEYMSGGLFAVYVQNRQTIVRTRLPNGLPTTVEEFSNLSDMASITFSPSMGRWYFHYEGTSQFRSGDEALGFAKATYTQDPGFPVFLREPTGTTVYAETDYTFSAFATGAQPITYQWYFEGALLQDETNQTLTIENLSAGNAGRYSVVAANNKGSTTSGAAELDVISAPRFSYVPASFSTFQGSNATIYIGVEGAPPISYQWWFNGTNLIADATNFYLLLTNIQPAQGGVYQLVASNRFGVNGSGIIELYVAGVHDDGTTFRIATVTPNRPRVVATYSIFDDNEYGPLAVSSNSVFFSSYNRSARINAADLSGGALISRYYYALLSNLRNEKVYVLGNGDSVPTSYDLDQALTLWELDPTTGVLGNHVDLSMPIPNLSGYNSAVGFFSGYNRAVVLNGSRAYNIALPSGIVTDLGPMQTPSHSYSYIGAFWGVAEHVNGLTYLVYVQDYYDIARVRVPDGQISYPFQPFSNLGYYMNAISVSIKRGRWYFQHNWDSQFAPNNSSTLGYADATFVVNSGGAVDHFDWQPIASPQRAGTPFTATLEAKNTDNNLISSFNGHAILRGISSPAGSNILIEPNLVTLTNGIWSGPITVQQATTNMYLRAEDTNGNVGVSSMFLIKPANDLVLTMTATPNPVIIGEPQTYFMRVSNTGPDQVTGVLLTNFLTATMVQFVSAVPTQGACSNVGQPGYLRSWHRDEFGGCGNGPPSSQDRPAFRSCGPRTKWVGSRPIEQFGFKSHQRGITSAIHQ